MGLKKRIETGLDQVFELEEAAVILEEDCHPTPDFFPFCAEMLARYRDEPKVAGISGNCFLPLNAEIKTDYFFSRYLHIWGWATWARAWNSYDRKKWAWPAGGFRELFPESERREQKYWNRIFARMATGRLSTWDYGFISWIWMNGQVAITPAQNFVRNAGFGPDATNTRDESAEAGIEREERLQPPFRGSADIRADGELDRLVFQNHLLRQEGRLSFWPRIRRSILKRISA
ncbi:MAG: methyltransferase type 11 [Proteobacteria bacterium]|nr:methyltransferase type 11 [Pseudomonadota bacterium]NBS06497.1 methyltransferase type 11 [Verrucomicrobiota bacterium]NBS49357.1 methyltransferase type 11 [Verrucomicrobiota bacterium]NBS78868.1 methyltransferase type 11 [bacterium]